MSSPGARISPEMASDVATMATAPDAAPTETTVETGVLPCPHFEGVEKRIEIDFHDGRLQRGTFQLSFPATERPRADPCRQALKHARNEINNVYDR